MTIIHDIDYTTSSYMIFIPSLALEALELFLVAVEFHNIFKLSWTTKALHLLDRIKLPRDMIAESSELGIVTLFPPKDIM